MYKRREYPEKSWSFSRHKSFIDCKRSFYFNTFAHWNGWEIQAPEKAKIAYRLKKLTNVYALSGQLLHEEIAQCIKTKSIDVNKSLKRIRSKLNKAVLDSKGKVQKWKVNPRDYDILHEYYYGNGVSKELGNKITKRMEVSLDNFVSCYTWSLIKHGEIEIIEFEKDNFPYFMHRDYKIYSILDLLYKLDGKYHIVYWKSGHKSLVENKRQMGIYALYVLNKYPSSSVSIVKGHNEYLGINDRESFSFTIDELTELKNQISDSMDKMDARLYNKEKNIPLSEEEYEAEVGEPCRYCNFIELCEAGLKYLKD